MALKLIITHSVLNVNAEKRFDENLTVGEFKNKIVLIVGTNPDDMILQLRDNENKVQATLQPDSAKLSAFKLKNFDNIHCVDTKPDKGIVAAINAANTGKNVDVPEYKLDEKAYAKRNDTFQKFKEKNLKDFYAKKEEKMKDEAEKWENAAKNMKKGDRCQVFDKNSKIKHRGVVQFVGKTDFNKHGIWVGVELDEPYGKHNGTYVNFQSLVFISFVTFVSEFGIKLNNLRI